MKQRKAQACIRGLIWSFYRDLKPIAKSEAAAQGCPAGAL